MHREAGFRGLGLWVVFGLFQQLEGFRVGVEFENVPGGSVEAGGCVGKAESGECKEVSERVFHGHILAGWIWQGNDFLPPPRLRLPTRGVAPKPPAMKRRYAILATACLALLGACNAEKPETTEPAKPAEATEATAGTKVRLKTNQGDIVIELNAEKAPITTRNFLKYVGDKHYDGTVFHRVIDGFMIQGGGFALDGGKLIEKETGEGIRNESQNGLKNDKGTIAMARTNDPDSATAQFFINVADNGMLNYPSNNGYAVFGKVVEGMEVVEKIKAVKTGTKPLVMRHPATGQAIEQPAGDVPLEPVVIESATAAE